MDGFMRLVDASKRALASPSRKAGTKDGDSSIDSMGHVAATALPEDDVPTTAVQDTLGTIDSNIGKAGVSDTNLGICERGLGQYKRLTSKVPPSLKKSIQLRSAVDVLVMECEYQTLHFRWRRRKVLRIIVNSSAMQLKPRVHPPDIGEKSWR